MGALPHANQRLVHVRIGDAPGWRNHGRARKIGGVGSSEGCRLTNSLCVPLRPLWLNVFVLATESTEVHREIPTEQNGCLTLATSSSSAAVTTVWSPPPIWPVLDLNR